VLNKVYICDAIRQYQKNWRAIRAIPQYSIHCNPFCCLTCAKLGRTITENCPRIEKKHVCTTNEECKWRIEEKVEELIVSLL